MNHTVILSSVNIAFTKQVIALHNEGYIFDFSVTANHGILCIQDGRVFTINQVTISLIDQRFDEVTACYKYIHVVDTCCGDKGLLIDCRIRVNVLLTEKAHSFNNNINKTYYTII